jgi:predicted nucleic acid-binding protein
MIATNVRVVDASALGAVLFAEPQADAVAARLRGGQLVAPVLLTFEIANTCLKKIRRYPDQRDALLAGFEALSEFAIDFIEIDPGDALVLAVECGLTFYDTAYLWLARRLACELVTLDGPLHAAWSAGPSARRNPDR